MTNNVFTLCTIGFKGANPQPVFAFHAADQEEADRLTGRWTRYHGMSRDTAISRPATETEAANSLIDGYMRFSK